MSESQNNQSEEATQNSTAVFADYARYYDLLYRDKDYAAETEYVAGLIRKFHPSARSILELGSGTGIHASLLAEKGYEVTGIDLSLDMVNIARSNGEATPQPLTLNLQPIFLEEDIREVRLNELFDAVIALFHVISYQFVMNLARRSMPLPLTFPPTGPIPKVTGQVTR